MVSCHVERPLDDRAWAAFSELQERRPGGLAIAALLRPPDPDAGEDERRWLERAREAVDRGPFGHHTHFTGPTHARPTGGDTGGRVRREAAWLHEQGLWPTLFCGGGWYTDRSVALACAELGYTDCTPRTTRPRYLARGEAWAQLAAPARIDLGGATLVAVPTTHSPGQLVRALLAPGMPARVHAYFHDTDLLHPRRRSVVLTGLALLGRRRPVADLDVIGPSVRDHGATVAWEDVARGESAASPA